MFLEDRLLSCVNDRLFGMATVSAPVRDEALEGISYESVGQGICLVQDDKDKCPSHKGLRTGEGGKMREGLYGEA